MWEAVIAEIVAEQSPEENVCLGEDLLTVLSAALKYFHPRGLRARRDMEANDLITFLIAGFEISEFERDEMYWELRSWQRSNQIPVLKEWRSLDPFGILLDQRYWQTDLERFLSSAKIQPLAVFKLDLDNFKSVNDSLGHGVGDEAICLYCQTVHDEIGTVAEIYRRGGDEVIAFAPFVSSGEARERAEALRDAIEQRFKHWSSKRGLLTAPTASIGLVICDSTHPKEDVMIAVDNAQKQAKIRGKNMVVQMDVVATNSAEHNA